MSARAPLPKDVQALHLHIGRVVIDAPAGADRQAIARLLAHELPIALRARLAPGGADVAAHGTQGLSAGIAEAVAGHLQSAGTDSGPAMKSSQHIDRRGLA